MCVYSNEKKDYLRKLDIRIKRWVRMAMPDLTSEESDQFIEKLISEGEKIYDEVEIILNKKLD